MRVDGPGRTPDRVDPVLRARAAALIRHQLTRPLVRIRPRWLAPPALGRLREVRVPTLVAGTPPQLVAYYRALAGVGMRYFIVHCSREAETLRLLGEAVVPHVAAALPQAERSS